MTTVYLLGALGWGEEDTEYAPVGIFSSKEKAEAFVNTQWEEDAEVEYQTEFQMIEVIVDEPDAPTTITYYPEIPEGEDE